MEQLDFVFYLFREIAGERTRSSSGAATGPTA